LLIGAVIAASIGYVGGAKATLALGAEQTISWVCVLALPLSLPCALVLWPQHAVPTAAWGGFLYVGVVSMWAGFFAWFRGMALGGALRASQTQLLQPFISIVAAAWLLNETLDPLTLIFALGVVITVLLGKKFILPPTPIIFEVSDADQTKKSSNLSQKTA
jgi:drug/metabolite transporter (DMT)-like permease